jgi:hypothetical protein
VVNASVETPNVVAIWAPRLPTAYAPTTAATAKTRITVALAFVRILLVMMSDSRLCVTPAVQRKSTRQSNRG